MLARLSEGVDPLRDGELNAVQSILADKAGDIQRLADLGLPLTLVHHDFRSDNLVMTANGPRIYDWADTLITHPFLVLYRVIGDCQATRLGRYKSRGTMAITETLLDEVRESYFSALADLAPEDDLQAAWHLLLSLVDAYVLTRQMLGLGQDEHGSSGYLTRLASLRLQARLLIEMQQAPPHGPVA